MSDLTNNNYIHEHVCVGNLFAGVGGYEILFPAAVQVCIDRGGRLATNAEAQADIVNNLHESGVGCGCFWVAEEEVHYISDCDPNKYWNCPLHPSGWGINAPGWNALCYGNKTMYSNNFDLFRVLPNKYNITNVPICFQFQCYSLKT